MAYLPLELGVVDLIQDALVDLLENKLTHEIPIDDASRAETIKVGPRQDDPTPIVVLIHEQDPDSPNDWPHRPVKYRVPRRSSRGYTDDPYEQPVRQQAGYELIGGGSRMARAFTIEIEVWGDELPGITAERRDVGHLGSLLESRIRKALKEAGPKIGTGALISDNSGESVVLGPYWGEGLLDQEEGEALIYRKKIRLYYVTTQDWDTDDW